MSDFSAFAELERRSWLDATRASGYVELFAAAPDQAIDHLLDAAGARRDLEPHPALQPQMQALLFE